MTPARRKWAQFVILTQGLLLALAPPATRAEEGVAAAASPASTTAPSTTKKMAVESDASMEELFEKRRFSLNVRGAEIREVLRIIADKGSLELKLDSSISGKSNLSLKDVTLGEALDRLAEDHGLEYLIEGDRLSVKRLSARRARTARLNSRSPAESGSAASAGGSLSSAVSGSSSIREIPIRFTTADQIIAQVQPMLEKDDVMIVDKLSNTILFQGEEESYQRALEFIRMLDRLPQQVLIEAQVVETSRSFLQAYGLAWGNDQGAADQTLGVMMSAAGPQGNGKIRLNIGQLAGGRLEMALSAAESNGDARVISRPKVVTLNNTPAQIDSGVSFYVKTLSSTVTGGSGGGLTAATGGVTRLSSGLQLSVTPTIMGKDLVKLMININNSAPDEAQAVDGIPGILNNSASTSVIVSEGRTAVIAGLVKNTGGKSSAGVPFFQNIPILGALFRNSTYSDRNNELVMFITPQIVTPQMDLKPERNFGEPKISVPAGESAPSGT